MPFVAGLLLALVLLLAVRWQLRRRAAARRGPGDLAAAVDADVARFMRRGPPRALVVGVIKEGRTWVKGYGRVGGQGLGEKAQEHEAAVLPDGRTSFQIASVTKVFTASLLQLLADEGVVGLDATLQALIGATVPLAPSAAGVTLRQLATHTSGFPSVPRAFEAEIKRRVGAKDLMRDPYSHLGPEAIFGYLATAEGQRRSGRFAYSNYGMGLLGHVLERVAGRDLEALMHEKLLAPLGMAATRFTPSAGMDARRAPGLDARGAPTPLWTFASLAGAGGLHTDADDLLRFVAANLGPAPPGAEALAASLCRAHAPQARGDTGLGWMRPTFIDRWFGNRGVVWHNGMVAGYAAYLSIDPAAREGCVVLCAQGVDITMLGVMLTRHVRTQAWRAPLPPNLAPSRSTGAPAGEGGR